MGTVMGTGTAMANRKTILIPDTIMTTPEATTELAAGCVVASAETTPAALYRLMTWLSPQFPVGSYTYSHGIEQAVEAGCVTTAAAALTWIEDIVGHGAGRSDAIIVLHAHAAASASEWRELAGIAELAAVLQPASELTLETLAQGRAFLETVRKSWDCPALAELAALGPGPIAYPVAVGVAAAGHRIPAELVVRAYLHAFAGNLVSAAVRLVPLGQSDGQRLIAALEPLVGLVGEQASRSTLDDLGSAVAMSDICAMRHETQYTRLFRS
jgi:urease accessory protein